MTSFKSLTLLAFALSCTAAPIPQFPPMMPPPPPVGGTPVVPGPGGVPTALVQTPIGPQAVPVRGVRNKIEDFGAGVADTFANVIKGVTHAVLHPIDTLSGVGNSIMHPIITAHNIQQSIRNSFARDPYYASGELAANIGLLIAPIGVGGNSASKGAAAAKSVRVAKPGAAAAEFSGTGAAFANGQQAVWGSQKTVTAAISENAVGRATLNRAPSRVNSAETAGRSADDLASNHKPNTHHPVSQPADVTPPGVTIGTTKSGSSPVTAVDDAAAQGDNAAAASAKPVAVGDATVASKPNEGLFFSGVQQEARLPDFLDATKAVASEQKIATAAAQLSTMNVAQAAALTEKANRALQAGNVAQYSALMNRASHVVKNPEFSQFATRSQTLLASGRTAAVDSAIVARTSAIANELRTVSSQRNVFVRGGAAVANGARNHPIIAGVAAGVGLSALAMNGGSFVPQVPFGPFLRTPVDGDIIVNERGGPTGFFSGQAMNSGFFSNQPLLPGGRFGGPIPGGPMPFGPGGVAGGPLPFGPGGMSVGPMNFGASGMPGGPMPFGPGGMSVGPIPFGAGGLPGGPMPFGQGFSPAGGFPFGQGFSPAGGMYSGMSSGGFFPGGNGGGVYPGMYPPRMPLHGAY